ncbi:MAG: hypothetical protein ACOC95_09000, partial [Planctomycetota bacterium]
YLNGTRISEEAPVEPGARLQVGQVVLTVQVDGQPADVTPPPVAKPAAAKAAAGKAAAGAGDDRGADEEDIFAQMMMDEDEDEEDENDDSVDALGMLEDDDT